MKNYGSLIATLILFFISLSISSCKKDDEDKTPNIKSKLGFIISELTVNEADDIVELEVVLDKPVSTDINVQYTLEGTAIEKLTVNAGKAYDYEDVKKGSFKILKGEKIGVIKLKLISDNIFDDNETIDLTLKEIDSNEAEITRDDELIISIENNGERPKLSFVNTSIITTEDDGSIEIQVTLDKAATTDVVVAYTLSGTASEKTKVLTDEAYDYEDLNKGTIEIAEGAITATIDIDLFSDPYFEDDETIIIQLKDVNSIKDKTTVTVNQEDGLIILLEWPEPTTDSTADMDIILRAGSNGTNWEGILDISAFEDNEPPELIFLPQVSEYTNYGLSYVYYSGTRKVLQFDVTFIDFKDGALEPVNERETFEATYKAANKNPFTSETIGTTIVVQTFVKTGGVFTSISDITVPSTSSRVELPNKSTPISPLLNLKKEKSSSNKLQYILKRINR